MRDTSKSKSQEAILTINIFIEQESLKERRMKSPSTPRRKSSLTNSQIEAGLHKADRARYKRIKGQVNTIIISKLNKILLDIDELIQKKHLEQEQLSFSQYYTIFTVKTAIEKHKEVLTRRQTLYKFIYLPNSNFNDWVNRQKKIAKQLGKESKKKVRNSLGYNSSNYTCISFCC